MAGRSERVRHLLSLLVVTVVVVYLYGDLLSHQAFLSHEQFFTYMRADQVAKELVTGHMPQVFPDALYGAGFAFPRFYPPLSLWLSAALALLVGDTCLGVNLAFFLSAVASGIAMYVAAAAILRDRWLSVASALVYVSLPYRFVDVFARGALAEAWTFAWYPIVVLGLWRSITRRVFPWYLPVSVAALLLTHNITALYFLVFCACFVLLGMKWHGWRAAILPSLALALGLGISLWFLLPQQYYMRSVWVSDPSFMWADSSHVNEHRVMPWQFLFSHPRLWFGESHGPEYDDGMSFELGAGHGLMLLAAFVALFAARSSQEGGGVRLRMLGRIVLAGWAVCVVFMLWPLPFLVLLPRQFSYVQFPWRLLAPAGFFAALGLGIFARRARLGTRAKSALVVTSIVIALLVPSFERTMWTESGWTDAELLSAKRLRLDGDLGYTVLAEYLPRDFDIKKYRNGDMDGARFKEPSIVDASDASITDWSRDGLDMRVSLESDRGCTLVLPLVFYDFYRAEGSGGRLQTFSAEGFLAVRVPPGVETVSITRHITPVMVASLAVSAVAAVLLVVCAVVFRRRPRARRTFPRSAPVG